MPLAKSFRLFGKSSLGHRSLRRSPCPNPRDSTILARLDAFLDAVRWGAASSADVKNVQSPFRSGIDIEDYQLDPVVRAIQMPRVNLLIADDVGIGKTIECGMVKLELVIRHRARRILVVCPASLQVQWRDQMRDKFGLDYRIVDSELMRRSSPQAWHPRQPVDPFPPPNHVHRLPETRAATKVVQGNAAR